MNDLKSLSIFRFAPRPFLLIAELVAAWRVRQDRRASLATLASLDAATRADIGLEASQPETASLLDVHPAAVASRSGSLTSPRRHTSI